MILDSLTPKHLDNLALHVHRMRLTLLAADGTALTTSPVLDTRRPDGRYTHLELLRNISGVRPRICLNLVPTGVAEAILSTGQPIALEVWERVDPGKVRANPSGVADRFDTVAMSEPDTEEPGATPIPNSALCQHDVQVVALKLPRLVDWQQEGMALTASPQVNPAPEFRLGVRPHGFQDTSLSLALTNEFPDPHPAEVWNAWVTAGPDTESN